MKKLLAFCLTVAVMLPVSTAFAQEAPAMPAWSMKLQMVITDTCGVNCPCLFGLDPHHDHCRFVGGFHITEGKYGDVSLDEVTWGMLGEFTGSRENQKWIYTAYYIDKSSSKAQRNALRAILSGPPFSMLGEQLGISIGKVNINVPDSPVGKHTLDMGKLGKFDVQPAIGNDPNTPITLANPVYPFPVKMLSLGTAVGTFSDHGKDMKLDEVNIGSGEIGSFELSGGGA
ncbi:MAG: DUF1326 domain-containing protein [Candidatus Dadabacteria bacterium]|nr:DUF1326 domain-containing protein [Candidatus Dadabacteria bacterium]